MAWSRKVLQDEFFLKAQKAGYVSRAAFKLKQIQDKHKIISPGGRILDLGCAPGAWMQVACQEIKSKAKGGLVLGIDIQEVEVPSRFCDERVKFIQGDVTKLTPSILESYSAEGFDVVLSDMMSSTTGNSSVDVGQSLELASAALQLATGYHPDLGDYGEQEDSRGVLTQQGNLVIKIFEGAGIEDFMAFVRPLFGKISRMRPKATRKASREIYLVCKELKSFSK